MLSSQIQFLLVCSICTQIVNGSRILMVTLAGTKSHKIPFLELGKGLSERGHNVTFVNAFPTDNPNPLIDEINPTNLVLYIKNFTNWDLLGPKLRGQMPVPIIDIFKFGYEVCEAFLTDGETKNLMRRGIFDLMILDGAYPECAAGLAHHFRVPFIYVNTVGFYTGSLSMAGNPAPYSVTPYLGLAFSDNMHLLQRLTNAAHHLCLAAFHAVMVKYFLHRVLKTHINPAIPSPYDISKNVSLIFQNGHFSLTYPRPFLPSVVEIACIHCRPSRPLPKDIEQFINSGKGRGFVYVSMGSSVKASNMPQELRVLFLNVFRSLPYQILWKWESPDLTQKLDLPKNVMLSHWFPQQDLLGHPHIRAFVTHGGLLSLFETVYHGVPVVAMPVFCDHDANVEKAIQDGYAVRLEWQELTVTRLMNSISTVINDPQYKINALRRSLLLKDQQESPIQRAIFWTEYVIRHKGGHHLQSPSKDMNIIRYYLIDVIILTIILIYLVIYFLHVIYKFSSKVISCKYNVKLKYN